MPSRRAIFLDRDGTLIVNRHYLADPAGVELLPGVRDTLHGLLRDSYLLFLFTNQSGVGRGMFTLDAVHRCNARMLELLDLPSPGFTDVCIVPETPDVPPVYRKPSPRFILETLERHGIPAANAWMVGDGPADVDAGLNAGIRSALLDGDGRAPDPRDRVWRVRDLADFYRRLAATSIP